MVITADSNEPAQVGAFSIATRHRAWRFAIKWYVYRQQKEWVC